MIGRPMTHGRRRVGPGLVNFERLLRHVAIVAAEPLVRTIRRELWRALALTFLAVPAAFWIVVPAADRFVGLGSFGLGPHDDGITIVATATAIGLAFAGLWAWSAQTSS